MEVLEEPDYRLRVRERPLLIWLVGGIMGLGPMPLLGFLSVAKIHCQRQTLPYECIATTSSFIIQERVNIPLSLLQQAKLEEDIDSEGDRMYRVVLEVSGNSIVFGSAASPPGDRAAMVQQMNQFLGNPNQTQLSARVDDRWPVGLMAGVFFLVGMSLIFFIPVLTLDLDRGSGTLTILHANFFRRTYQELSLRDIRDIAIESYQDSEGDRLYRVLVHLTSGDTVPLRQYYSSGYGSKKKLANLLREFLHLPPL
ncbi:hypothetical protein NIES2134_125160 [Thermostichus vulcanus NIES-2134]|nr:hypothetical protein NIES2134_125160 [Thermostichus vulcanus NIES-2134]